MMGMNMMSDLLAASERDGRFYGVTVGIVTNNKDEEGLGRVKVKFPWLSETDESYWARVLSPMAGKERGIYFLPEVNDEVLVAFAHGDMESPYILGALWNGEDKPPETNSDGKNNRRMIKSRSGHQIILDDTQDKEQIIIRDSTEKNQIIIDSKENTLSIKVEKDITIEAKGKITIKSSDGDMFIMAKNLTIEAQKKCAITGESLQIESWKNLDLNAGQDLNVQAGKCEINANKCNMTADGGMALASKAGVKINDSSLEVIK
jgi:uncharacterized protein involved in type VI secretion and phage assembly